MTVVRRRLQSVIVSGKTGEMKRLQLCQSKGKKYICMRRNEAPAVPKIAPSRLDLSSANPGGITREVRVRVSVKSENKIISAKEEV